jgi:hypothetical protein
MVNLYKKEQSFAQHAVYLIIVFVILYLCTQVIKAIISFQPFFNWWNKSGGKSYAQGFDILSFALFQESRLCFNIRQAFISGQDRLNYTDVMLIQSIAFNQARILTDYEGNPLDGNFVLPHHLTQGIAWSSADDPIFKNTIKYWVAASQEVPGPSSGDSTGITTSTKGYDWPIKYNGIGPEDSKWTNIIGYKCNGFWPHQNGCTGFFDMPGNPADGVIPYDLLTNPARSVIGEQNSLKAGKAPKFRDASYNENTGPFNDLYLQGDTAAPSRAIKVSMYYIPGYPGPQGSWAQLFADFGIIYTESSRSGDSKVPVVSDGTPCGGSTPLDPCPITCAYGANKCSGGTGMPVSDFNIWYGQSRFGPWGSTTNPNVYGPNFFSAFRMDPESYIFTSWVGNIYDDPTTGIILDPQAIKNLIGMAPPGLRAQGGGWTRFFKGINTDLKSYDDIMNELFSKYATQFTPRAQIQNTPSTCGASGWLSSVTSGVGLGMMGFFIPPPAGPIIGGIAALLGFVSSAMEKKCF